MQDYELSLSQKLAMEDEVHKNEITNCTFDSSYFVNNFVRLETSSGPSGLMLDTPKEELLELLETEPLLIGRYPRIYGKTTTLAGFALHQALFLEKTILYGSFNHGRRLDFLRQISYIYRNLPKWMRKSHQEGPNGFVIDRGAILPVGNRIFDIEGKKFDYLIFDEVGTNNEIRVQDFANVARSCRAKFSVVGTFKPDDPIVGQIWSEARNRNTGWASLPSFNEEWKVETILSLVDEKFAVGY
jgi:hypothetical protein